jgi:peptidoglycan hydrolase CwlO-like protein
MLSHAQPQTREELEKQRAQLKKEIEQTEKLLSSNKMQTKENLLQYKLITNKVNLQDRVIDNINRDLHLLENNMYSIAKDVKRYDRLLDTLKQEYAKSMVYAYKNRSSYDFLNFIFSAENFNDAIKRISYLKSYRSYREMQGENILRTQELRKKRIQDFQ